nr:MAG: coat protein [Narnaviridae sp.]
MSKREKKSSAPRKSKRGGGRTKSRGGSKSASMATIARSGVPVSQAIEMPRFYTNIASVAHKTHGDGLRISGTMNVGTLQSKNAFYDVFENYAASYYLHLHPIYLAPTNSRFYAIAVQYQRFGFRRVKFWYVPNCSTATPGNFAMAYYQDPVQVSNLPVDTTYSELMESGNVGVMQAWRGSSVDMSPYLDKDYLGWSDLDATGSDVSWRQQIQGGFKFAQAFTGTSLVEWGQLIMEYDLELYQPSRFIDKALMDKQSETRDLRRRIEERKARNSELKNRELREKDIAERAADLERILAEETAEKPLSSTQGPSGACAGTTCQTCHRK